MRWGKVFGRRQRTGDALDWRLTGQSAYLHGRQLRWAQWRPYRPGWDHDHCEFCTTEISDVASEHAPTTAAYVTADDDYHWICRDCFDDFRGSFAWTVVEADH